MGKLRQWLRTPILIVSVLILFGQSGVRVFADDTSQCPAGMSSLDCQALLQGWVNWVPDDNNGTSCTATGSSVLVGNDNEEKIWNFLIGKGLSATQAAGIMGNLSVESAGTWSPAVHQVPSATVFNSAYENGFGIAQWDGGRRYTDPDQGVVGAMIKNQADLKQYVDGSYDPRNKPPLAIPAASEDAMLSFELNYLYQEGTARIAKSAGFPTGRSEWDTIKTLQTIDDATVFWHNDFEVSSDSAAAVLSNRGGAAHDAFDKYSTATASGITSIALCSDTSGIAATVLAYAWPTYHPPTYLDRQPAYATAIAKSEAAGLYVGNDNGIDCGGFITTLMINSGFEPNYNAAGKGGNTIAQQQWLDANWSNLGSSSSINVADLHPGDVAINADHTFVWVGDITGFGAKIASASTGDGYQRAPMADTSESPTDPGFTWYRKK